MRLITLVADAQLSFSKNKKMYRLFLVNNNFLTQYLLFERLAMDTRSG
jgi:hypothetical protein